MERNQIISEFLNLRKVLNQGNKLANEKTTLSFQIEPQPKSEYRLLLSAVGSEDKRKIEICRRNRRGHWERSGLTAFKKFEEFCAYYLNQKEHRQRSVKKSGLSVEQSVLDGMANDLKLEFDDLLLNYAL
jgi:hypothetical protein